MVDIPVDGVAGDLDGDVGHRGSTVAPCQSHRLTKLLMQAYFAKGNIRAAGRVFESHQAALEQLELDDVDGSDLSPPNVADVVRTTSVANSPPGTSSNLIHHGPVRRKRMRYEPSSLNHVEQRTCGCVQLIDERDRI